MHPISVMIKPSSSSCNLRCRYCFYADEASLRTIPNYGFMTPELLEQTIPFFMNTAEGSCSFMFQGGEPTLAGLDFFRKVVSLQKQYARPDLRVTNALQTNGMLLDEAWCSFLAENHFLVGFLWTESNPPTIATACARTEREAMPPCCGPRSGCSHTRWISTS